MGVQLDPRFVFASPIKLCKKFSQSFFVITEISDTHLLEKKMESAVPFSGNQHKLALLYNVTKLFWLPFWKGMVFFFPILFRYSKSIQVLLWAKFHWKILLGKWFFNFWPHNHFREMEISIWPPFWNSKCFWHFSFWFMDLVIGAYRYSASFVPRGHSPEPEVWVCPAVKTPFHASPAAVL